jgi:ParB-like chromosome segregation protein Spo0J
MELKQLNPHEQIIEENLKKVLTSLKVEKRLKEPVVVDKETKVILDGHHRVKAFEILGLRDIPCRLVDYSSDGITIAPNRNGNVSKEEVIEKGLSDELFPPKTSKHVFEFDSEDSATNLCTGDGS